MDVWLSVAEGVLSAWTAIRASCTVDLGTSAKIALLLSSRWRERELRRPQIVEFVRRKVRSEFRARQRFRSLVFKGINAYKS